MSDYLKKRQGQKSYGTIAPDLPKKKYAGPKKISDKKAAMLAAEKENRIKGGGKTDLEKWYEKIMKTETAVCWETGKKINKSDMVAWHGSVAHVLPKNLFPSVATHPLNYLILEMYGGAHGQYDSSWEKASKMKVWPIAVERFVMIQPDIAMGELKNIPQALLDVLPADVF